jgi:predicted phosphodiesterase
MRYLILSDVHSNQSAMNAVMAHARRKPWDKAVLLGDVVGYAAQPNQVVERLRALRPLVAIRGNHDKVCSGVESGDMFNRVALIAAHWTRARLSAANRGWLARLPRGPRVVDGSFLISHGTPLDEDAYLFGELEALHNFGAVDFRLCFFGHVHVPMVYALRGSRLIATRPATPYFRMQLQEGTRYLVNPGSIGQPRDGNPRAGYALYDAERRSLTFHRVAYPLAPAQEAIMAEGLPSPLATRLALGR